MGDQHQDQQKDGEDQQHAGRAAPALIVDLGHHEHGGKAQYGEDALPLQIEGGAAGFVIGGGEAGGEQHHKADHRQQKGQQQEGNVHPPALGGQDMLPLHGLAAHFFRVLHRRLLGMLGALGHMAFLLSVI